MGANLFSIYVWLIWGVGMLILAPIFVVTAAFSKEAALRVFQAWVGFLLLCAGIRVRVVGADKVDWDHTAVFMGNHMNGLDPFFFALSFRRHMVGIEKASNFKIPFYGHIVKAWGNIPIHRENPEKARATIAVACERLKSGASIGILPEGTRSKDGRIGPFKKGGFHLAIDAGADIVPFTISGAWSVLKNGDWRIHPGTVVVTYGERISTDGHVKTDLEPLMTQVRAAIEAPFYP